MSENKYTPGPWQVVHNPLESQIEAWNHRRFHVFRVAPSGHTEAIADTAAYEWATSPESHEANAQLIAASPDLLECVINMRQFIALWEIEHPERASACEAYTQAANAAIAKATGQEG